jgi:preprotein translocase subunit YajC
MILAQTTTAAPSGNFRGIGDFFSSPMALLFLLLPVLLYYSSAAKRKEEKDRKALMAKMKRGDRVQTIGGILGTVVEVRDAEIVVKVDESNNTKIKFARSAVLKIVTEDDKVDTAAK